MGNIKDFDPTRIDTTAEYGLGIIAPGGGLPDQYQYVGYHYGDGSVTATKGHIGYFCASGTESVNPFTVTEDHDATTKVNTSYALAAGEFMSALTNGTFGWIKKKGLNENIGLSDDSVDDGEQITPADADGSVKGVAAGTACSPVIGYGLVADGGTAPPVGSILWNFPI